MGSFLTQVKAVNDLKTNCPLVNLSLAKIRELHGGFKSICDNFAINLTEFENIFSSNEATFAIWDTDNNVLFDLFDFNEIQSLALMDLEFCIQCVLISTSKIFGVGDDVSDIEITNLIRSSFPEGSRITLTQLLKWASHTEEIMLYFKLFRMETPDFISHKPLRESEFIIYDKHNVDRTSKFPPSDSSKPFQPKSAAQLINNRRSQNFRGWLHSALQPIIAYRLENKTIHNYIKEPDEIKSKLEWVYGIRCGDTKRPLQYTVGKQIASSTGTREKYDKQQWENNEEIIYFTASIVVLFNPKINQQRFYMQHDQEVLSLAVSNQNGDFIATSELADHPKIHIWNCRTLDNINILKGIHRRGVHLLAFSNNDQFLVTCGLQNPSAVIIYEWRTSTVVISTSINSPTQDIFILPEISDQYQKEFKPEDYDGNEEAQLVAYQQYLQQKKQRHEGLIVLSEDEVVIFLMTKEDFSISYISFEEAKGDTIERAICGLAIVADHKNQFYKQTGEFGEKKHIFLTGHKDGHVLIWKLFQYVGVLHNYKDEITAISKCFEGIAIGTTRGYIYIWDNFLLKCIKTIELSQLPFKILSFNIVNIDYNQKKMLVLSIAGDVIEVTMSEYHSNKIKAKRINSITKLNGAMRALSILNQVEKTVMIGGESGIVCSYDLATHDLIDVWSVGQRITALACLSLEDGGFIVAAGTNEGNLIIRQDWEEIIPRHHGCGIKAINDIKFSKNGVLIAVASTDKNVYLLQYQDNDYVALVACRLENGFPVSLNFSEDSSKIVICTNQRKLLLLDPTNYQLMFKIEDVSQHFWSTWIGRYPLITKSATTSMIPIALGNLSNMVSAGDENGNVYFWKSVESIKDNIGLNFTGHTSHVQRIELTIDDKRLLTLGLTDQTLCQWKIQQITDEQSELNSGTFEEQQIKASKIMLEDDSLINELNFCYAANQQNQESFKDNTVLVRGSKNTTVNKIMSKLHFEYEDKTWMKSPAQSLVLEHIYGIQTADRRQSVMYVHLVKKAEQSKSDANKKQIQSASEALGLGGSSSAKLDMVLKKILGINYQTLVDDNLNITYDPKHQICHKFLVYFTARFAVVYNTGKNQQTFYQGHSLKISAIARHPLHAYIATGEVNINPSIHVWDANNLETIVILKTSHRGGVLQLAFSGDGQLLISIGMDKTFSLQVFQWEQGRTLAYRNTGYFPIFAVRFNPYDKTQIVTCGYEHMAVWKLKGPHLTCKSFQRSKSLANQLMENESSVTLINRSILLCMDFISYKQGHSIISDIHFGTSLGEITTFCQGKHFVLHENAHESAINCIKVTDSLSDRVNIFTGGEDGLLKLWDASIQLLQVIDMRKTEILSDLKNKRAFAIQSLDIYVCDRQEPRRILVGLRCGEVMEAIVRQDDKQDHHHTQQHNQDRQMLQQLMDQSQMIQQRPLLSFKFYSYLSSHSSLYVSQNQKKVFVAMYPLKKYSILASVGDDETLRLWDINKHQIMVSKNLGTQATSLSFSPDGSYLAVGLVNGVFLLLEAKIEKLNFGTYMEEYKPPTLDVLMSPKESKAAILSLKFSFKGDFLAISFDNEHKPADSNPMSKNTTTTNPQARLQGEKRETSFVLLFVNRLSGRNPGIKMTSKDPYVRMQKIVIPLAEYQAPVQLRALLAVTQLDFSEDDYFLEMCSQKVMPEHIRDYSEGEDIFVVWDISQNQIVSDFDLLKKAEWPGWCLSNSINARYQGNYITPENPEEEKKLRLIELCTMSSVQRFNLITNAVSGSTDGDLYLFRFPAMYIDKNNVIDFSVDKLRKIDMALTRGFSAHTSMVQCTEIHEDKYIFSTALSDQCILQWRVQYEDQDWELDFNKFQPEKHDPFAEVPTSERFKTLITEIWTQRLEVAETNQNIDQEEFKDPACELELETVIGRRAFDRRNNLKLDCQDKIIYSAGSLMVSLQNNTDPDAESPVLQTFLRPEEQRFTAISPEVSTFTLSDDKRILVIGTSQIEANVIIWEISTNLQLARLILPNCSIVQYLKMAHDNKHIIIIGLTKDYLQVIMIMDYTTQTVHIYRQIIHSLPYKIKDVAFYPGSTRKFVTCGIQHMCFWRQSGRNLECQIGELSMPRSFNNLGGGVFSHDSSNQNKFGLALVCDDIDPLLMKPKNADDELENIYVTFLTLGFLRNTLIASGDDGFLYLWEHERIVRRMFAHEGAIFTLDTNAKIGLIVSGGMEGTVVLWRLLEEQRSNIKSLDKLKTFNLAKNIDPQQAVINPDFNVQSVCLGYNRIIIGTRSGSIYETSISDDKIIKPVVGDKQNIRRWIKCIDHETPKSISIDMISSRIYILTLKGFFSVWDLQSFDVKFSKNFAKLSKAIISFKLSNKVMLVFENEITVLDSNPQTNTFDEIPVYSLGLNTVSDAKLNHNEKILGVATTSAAAPEVTLYDTDNGFTKMKTLYGFKSSIKYIDFSTDNYFLQCEDNLGEVLLFEIETQRVVHTEAIDFELEWLGEGLRSYSHLKGIHYWYSQSNRIQHIAKVIGRPIVIVGDELGTIRLFNYPNVTGQGYYRCYSEHLFSITNCLFSPDRKYFLSTSEMDRCIFKWKVNYNLKKIKQIQQQNQR